MEKPVIERWFADRADYTLRVTYPLTPQSIVLDVGGYEGGWAHEIDSRYGCTIHVFEPVPEFAENIRQRFAGRPNIHIHVFGLSDRTSNATIFLDKDSTSVHKSRGTPIPILLRNPAEVLAELNLANRDIDLIKINIEGSEYELLPHLVDTGLISRLRDIQVQFHDFVPNASERMQNVHDQLSKTHDLTWQYRFVWDNWRRK
jgi:FkbM family methyltransferase